MAISLLVALLVGGYFLFRTVHQSRLNIRALEIERRDQWIADTIAQLKDGESSVYLYSCVNTDLLLEELEGMPEVEKIIFEKTIDLSPKGFRYLPSFPNLRHLDFRGEKALNDETITILADCKALEILGIKLCGVTDAGIPAIGRISSLKELRHSREIGKDALSALHGISPGVNIRVSEWYR